MAILYIPVVYHWFSGCLWPFFFRWSKPTLRTTRLFSLQPLSLTHNLSLSPILFTSSTSSNLLQDLLEEGISGSGRDWWLVGWRDRMVKKVQFGTGPQQQLLLNSSTFNLTAFIANSYLAISIHATLLRQLLARYSTNEYCNLQLKIMQLSRVKNW